MPETPEFNGDLDSTVEHLLETAEDTPEDLKKQLDFARVSLAEGTSQKLDELQRSLGLETESKLTIQKSQDARLELAREIKASMEDNELSGEELVNALTKVLQEELIESVLTVEDLDSIPVDELREMEKKTPGTLLFAFTTWGDQHKGMEVSKLGNEYLPKDGDRFEIDFRGNEEAEWNIGAVDLLPPEARGITLKATSGQETVSERRIGLKGEERGGFYDANGDYMAIFTGDEVIVGQVDVEFRTKYFNAETGEWNYEAYDEEHAEEEAGYLVVPSSIDGNTAGRVTHRTERAKYSRSLDSLKEGQAEWYDTAGAASETFNRKLGVNVPVSSIFGVISKESAFDPEAVSSSGCMGLGQFGKAAWSDFLSQNTALARTVLQKQGLRLPTRRSKRFELRTNAVLNIYATTWYLGKLAKRMGYDRVDSHNIKDVYLNYHEGVAGRRALENYVRKGRGRLYPWQKSDPRGYWKSINHYAGQVAAQTAQYEDEESNS